MEVIVKMKPQKLSATNPNNDDPTIVVIYGESAHVRQKQHIKRLPTNSS